MGTANAAAFDGSNDNLTVTSYTGLADSKLLSFAVWMQHSQTPPRTSIEVLAFGASRFYEIFVDVNGQWSVQAENSSGTLILDVSSGATVINDTSWHCIMGSFDLSDTSKRHLYFGDTSVLSVSTYTNDTIAFTNPANHYLFGRASIRLWDGAGSIIWINPGQYIDFSTQANRRIFFGPNGKVPALLAASTTGNVGGLGQPRIFLNNGFATYQNNLGSGGGLTLVGALTTATGPEIEINEVSAGVITTGLIARTVKLNTVKSVMTAILAGASRASERVTAAVLVGGLAAISFRRNLIQRVIAGALAVATELKLASATTQNFFLLLEDGSSYLLLEDNSSKIIIEEGGSQILAAVIVGTVLDINRKVGRTFANTVGGVVATAETMAARFLGAAVTVGGLLTRQIKVSLGQAVLAGAVSRVVRKINWTQAAIASGLANAQTALAGVLTLISAAVKVGGLAARTVTARLSKAVTAAGIVVASLQQLALTIFSGGMGLGSVHRPGGGWRKWRDKSRRR